MTLDPQAASIRPRLISFHDFVEQALFHPRWGYYSTGAVRFGDGGDFDTYPIALSPYFGRMVLARAQRLWRSQGRPRRFEICEIGAGNGQLCVDVLTGAAAFAARRPTWRAFAAALHYRIVEKSPALRRRQREHLGSLAARVTWDAVDLSRGRAARPRGRHGFVVANEVLDCLAHHKVVRGRDGVFRVAFVGAWRGSALLTPRQRNEALARGERLRITEHLLPVSEVRGLGRFLHRHYADAGLRRGPKAPPWVYFACPAAETFVKRCAALYADAEILLIDYGGDRDYHLHTPAGSRIAAGRPEDPRATPYRAPGRDDVTFLVDFSVAISAAKAAGLGVVAFDRQGALARLSGTRLGAAAEEDIIRHRSLAWLLAVAGVGPERRQRSTALSWSKTDARGRRRKSLAREVREAIDGFLGRRPDAFHLLLLRKKPTRS